MNGAPLYATHDRVAVRHAGTVEGTWQRQTVDMYTQLMEHVLRVYPDSGPLRSTALRKLAESLNDVLDHDYLVRAHRQQSSESYTSA